MEVINAYSSKSLQRITLLESRLSQLTPSKTFFSGFLQFLQTSSVNWRVANRQSVSCSLK